MNSEEFWGLEIRAIKKISILKPKTANLIIDNEK
uniref:Uncharacterized protein n=1 Tax=Gloeothece verrucosa (strain PCC 7822) TaxID=497965 RepID=E0UDC6_GLOV7|nr:hypothetical protein Cyan7822_2137 [Gloeothece verrucosa PCC 7822]